MIGKACVFLIGSRAAPDPTAHFRFPVDVIYDKEELFPTLPVSKLAHQQSPRRMIRARGAMASEKSGAWFSVRGGLRHEDGERAQSDVACGGGVNNPAHYSAGGFTQNQYSRSLRNSFGNSFRADFSASNIFPGSLATRACS